MLLCRMDMTLERLALLSLNSKKRQKISRHRGDWAGAPWLQQYSESHFLGHPELSMSLWLILIWNWEKTHNSVWSGRHYFFEGICVQLDSMKYAIGDYYRFEPKQRVLSFLALKKYMICLCRMQCLETSAFHQCLHTNFSCKLVPCRLQILQLYLASAKNDLGANNNC